MGGATRPKWLDVEYMCHDASAKISRNQPCPCNSGLRWKRCCLLRKGHYTTITAKGKRTLVRVFLNRARENPLLASYFR